MTARDQSHNSRPSNWARGRLAWLLPLAKVVVLGGASSLFGFACIQSPDASGPCGSRADTAGDLCPKLIGGDEAGQGVLPSAIVIAGSCTAAVVGPQHILTAAHCVYQHGWPSRAAGDVIAISNWRGPTDLYIPDGTYATTIRDVHIHPSYQLVAEYCVQTGSCPVDARGDPSVVLGALELGAQGADIAVIELESSLPQEQFPPAPVDLRPVAVGDPLIIGGYGCELAVNGARDGSHARYKIEETLAISVRHLRHLGSSLLFRSRQRFAELDDLYVVTPGRAYERTEASLCPGDSGGPVFRDDGSNVVVGVNAYYSFPLGQKVSRTNWHTRVAGVAAGSPADPSIGDWLTGLGVPTVSTPERPGNLVGSGRPGNTIVRYDADDPRLGHAIGELSAAHDGPTVLASHEQWPDGGYLSYGPYDTFADLGARAMARFEVLCHDGESSQGDGYHSMEDGLLTLDIHDHTSDQVLWTKDFSLGDIEGADLTPDQAFAAIEVPFDIPAEDHRLELRAFFWGSQDDRPSRFCALRAIEVSLR